MLLTFYLLIIAHLISDFIIQGNLALKKAGFNRYMIVHCTIASVAFLLPLLNYPLGKSLLGALIIFVSTLIIDNLKKKVDSLFKLNPEKYLSWAFLGVDQILHITVIFFTFQFLFY